MVRCGTSMSWTRRLDKFIPKRRFSKVSDVSLSRKLQNENKITEEFEVMLNSLTLEEIIALKLELASRIVNGKFYGFPLWSTLDMIIKDSFLKFALSACHSKSNAAKFLGIKMMDFERICKKYNIYKYFGEDYFKTNK